MLCRFQQLSICIATLKHPRWVKLGTLFLDKVNITKLTLLLQQGHKNITQKKMLSCKSKENNRTSKNYWVASRKALSL
jgi:hypothetical protein